MTWKDVDGYEGLYQVSKCGKVRSLKRNNTNGKVLKRAVNCKSGYLYVNLSKNAKVKTLSVHSLVERAFPSKTSGVNVLHLDGDRANPHADNLRRGSVACNAAFKVEHGSIPTVNMKIRKLSPIQSRRVQEYFDVGFSMREIGRTFGVAHHTISAILKRGE